MTTLFGKNNSTFCDSLSLSHSQGREKKLKRQRINSLPKKKSKMAFFKDWRTPASFYLFYVQMVKSFQRQLRPRWSVYLLQMCKADLDEHLSYFG